LTFPIITSGIASVYCPSAASTVASPVANQISLIFCPLAFVGAPNSIDGAPTEGEGPRMSFPGARIAALAQKISEPT
jgi:hypothetical protein